MIGVLIARLNIQLSHRKMSGEYRGAERPSDCDFFKTFAKMGVSRQWVGRRIDLARNPHRV